MISRPMVGGLHGIGDFGWGRVIGSEKCLDGKSTLIDETFSKGKKKVLHGLPGKTLLIFMKKNSLSR